MLPPDRSTVDPTPSEPILDAAIGVVRRARILDTQLSVDRALSYVNGPGVGGVGLFLGLVRNVDEGRGVTSLDYSQHPSAEAALLRCAERVAAQHDVLAIAVEHRVGHLAVGDLAVVVAVGAVHRGDALAACRRLIDDVKAEVPIWKEQHFDGGDAQWVGLA